MECGTECGRDFRVPFRFINLNLAGMVPSPRPAALSIWQFRGATGFLQAHWLLLTL